MRNVVLRRFGVCGAAAAVAAAYAGCTPGTTSNDPFVGRVIERTGQTREELTPATSLTQVWRTDFTSLKATAGAPSSANDWVFELFEPNGEVEQYTTNVCSGNNNPVGTNWNYCIQSGQGGGSTDGYALQIRAQNDSGTIHSGRLNSKRMHEFMPSANVGLQYEANIKFDANSINSGSWPAFWMLQRNINEAPVVGDTDNAPWPCLGAQEVDIMEMGSLGGTWNDSYNQSSLHYDTGGCYPQGPNANPSVNNNWAHQLDDGAYHKYTMEFECGSSCAASATMRFFVDGVQEGGDINATGAGYDQVASFFIINYAVGGGLGGTVNYNAFNNPGRSMYIDYLNVASYNPANRGGGGGGAAYRDISQHLASGSGNVDAYSSVQFESCTEGGQDTGYISNGSSVSWNVAVPGAGNYFVQTRSAVNNGGANATYDIYVDGVYKVSNSIANTGGWQNWATYSSPAFIPGAGNHVVKIVFTSGGQNLEWAQLVVSDTCNDGVQDQGETGIDCGGPCPACQATALGSTVQALNASYFSTTDLQRESGHISYWHPAAYARYDGVNLNSVAALTVAYATQNAGQVFEVRAGNGCNATTGTVLGDFAMPTTASWTSYTQATLNFATSLNLTTSLCLVAKSGNTQDLMNMQWFTLASGSGTQTGTGPTCSDGIQNQGETGVDCGGPCAACPTGSNPSVLQAINATITGGFNDGGTGVVLNTATSSLCWSNVTMTGNTSATVTYGNGQPPGDTLQVTFKGTNIGSVIPVAATGSWNTFTDGSTTFAAQSGSGTLCVATGTFAGPWVAKIVKVTLGTTAGSPPPPACTPATCASLGDNCGSPSDGCGGTLSCGSCTSPQTCGGGGTANHCGTASGGSPCNAAYAQSSCPAYYQGINVSSGGHNWLCSNGNCANCSGYASCAPGGSGCPWGVVWTDQGACH